MSLQVSGYAVFEHPQQPAVGMGQLWVRLRRALSAPGCSPGSSLWEDDVGIPEAFETPGLLAFSGHTRGDKHSRAGQRVSCAASGAQQGLGPLLGNDIFVNKIGKIAVSAKPSAHSLWLRQQLENYLSFCKRASKACPRARSGSEGFYSQKNQWWHSSDILCSKFVPYALPEQPLRRAARNGTF